MQGPKIPKRGGAAASWGTEPMLLSTTAAPNLLPHFLFMGGAGEGSSAQVVRTAAYAGGAPARNWTNGIESNNIPDGCPDDLFGPLSDYPDVSIPSSSVGPAPVLPYLFQDVFGCERTPTAVPTVVLEDENLRAAIMPQFGGKVWSLFDKRNKKQIIFNNPTHQPYTIAYLKAYTAGGIEWNWSPGYVGHTVTTESNVWTARLETERGPVVRVYEYDRFNHTTWQVDMMVRDGVFWAHPTITNSGPTDLPGYWWTCVGMRATPKTHVLSPADMAAFPCSSWPTGAAELPNVSFRGPEIAGRDHRA